MRSKEFRQLIANTIRAAAPVTPLCPHAIECGGCAFQERDYADQVAAKAHALNQLWRSADPEGAIVPLDWPIAVVPSPEAFAYRTRMDYVATKGRFGLRMRGKFNYIVDLTTCHLIPPSGLEAARNVYTRAMELGLPDYNIRSHEGFLRYIVVRRSPTDQFMLAAVTAAPDDERAAVMEQLAETALAQAGVVSFHWLINATKTDLSFGTPLRHWGSATLPMPVGPNTLAIGPNTFFQNNVHLLLPLLDAAAAAAAPADQPPPLVADLYGGVGTIALHLAPRVERVISVESVGESAELAQANIAANGATNVAAVGADVLDFLRESAAGSFAVAVADPPRTGLGPEVCRELLRIAPQRIVYVSCNPLTQVDDLRMLNDAYILREIRGYDMFPQTPHVETLAVLDRR